MILDSCKVIAENPELGKIYNNIKVDLFGFKANKHIIFYRKRSKELVEITRILHGRMDLKNRITEE